MSVRQELETLLSISQGTAEDYNEYLLRVLEEINAVDDLIFNSMSKDTQNWVNDGILAYNGNQPIPEFPKVIQQKVEEFIKVEPAIIPEQTGFGENLFEQESILSVSDELQAIANAQFESIPEQITSPKIEIKKQENIDSNAETTFEQAANEEILAEKFKNSRDDDFAADGPIKTPNLSTEMVVDNLVKKKRGRPKGTKNKSTLAEVKIDHQFTPARVLEKTTINVVESEIVNGDFKNKENDLLNNTTITEPEFIENEPFHFVIGTSDIPMKKKRGRKIGSKNKSKDINESIETTIEQDSKDGELSTAVSLHNYGLEYSDITTSNEFLEKAAESNSSISESQKPLDLFRTLVCLNHDMSFGELFKLAENQSIVIKKPTALVTCSQIKATITTLKNLGMLRL